MGCDIHLLIEVKEQGEWKVNTKKKVFPNTSYKLNSEYSFEKERMMVAPADDRNYDYFTFLANVRNRGDRENIKPIDYPRGVPEDATDKWKAIVYDWDCDMHSHSYIKLEDIENYDWSILELFPYCKEQVEILKEGMLLLYDIGYEDVRMVFGFDN